MTTPAQHARVWRKAAETIEAVGATASRDHFIPLEVMWRLANSLALEYEALAQELEKEA